MQEEGKLEVCHVPGKGLGLRSRVSFAVGERLASEAASLTSVLGDCATERSHWSLVGQQRNSKLSTCSASKFARYLDAEEQKRDWRDGYREEAAVIRDKLQAVRDAPTMARLAVRCYHKWKRDQGFRNAFDKLHAIDERYLNPDERRHVFRIAQFVVLFANHGVPPEMRTDDEVWHVMQVIRRLWCNVMTVTDAEQGALGICLFAELSRANHSDEPNALQVFQLRQGKRPTAHLVALRPILPQQEVCISYVDPAESWIFQQYTLEGYGIRDPLQWMDMADFKWAVIPDIASRGGSDSIQLALVRGQLLLGIAESLVALASENIRNLSPQAFQAFFLETLGVPLSDVVVILQSGGKELDKVLEQRLVDAKAPVSSLLLSSWDAELARLASLGQASEKTLELALKVQMSLDERLPKLFPKCGLTRGIVAKIASNLGRFQLASRFAKEACPALELFWGKDGEYIKEQSAAFVSLCVLKAMAV